MAALTLRAARNADFSHTVTKSTGDSISTAVAAVIVDNTKSKDEVLQALDACRRHLSREFGKVSAPSGVPTTGSATE